MAERIALKRYTSYMVLDDGETYGGAIGSQIVMVPDDVELGDESDFDDIVEGVSEEDRARFIRIDVEKVIQAIAADPKLLEEFKVD